MSLASPPPIDRRSRAPELEASRDRAPTIRSCVRGSGAALPAHVVSNAELATKVDTSDEWIMQRTGIRQRYIADPDENNILTGGSCGSGGVAQRRSRGCRH